MTTSDLFQLARRLWAGWCSLWAGECDLRPLGCFRIVWAVSALVFTWMDRDRTALFVPGRFHISAFDVAWAPTITMANGLLVVAGLAAFLVLLGLWSRLAAAAFVTAQTVLFASDLLAFRNHAYLFLLTGAILAVSPAGEALSLSGRAGFAVSKACSGPRWSSELLKAQFLVVYGLAASSKLNAAFLDGWVLEAELAHYFPKSFAAALLSGPFHGLDAAVAEGLSKPAVLAGISWSAMVLEFGVFACLAVPRFRRLGVLLGALLHLGIAATMNVFVFGALMLASYVLFVPPRAWRHDTVVESRLGRHSVRRFRSTAQINI